MRVLQIFSQGLAAISIGLVTAYSAPISPQAGLEADQAHPSLALAGKAGDFPQGVGRLTGVNWFGFETAGFAPHGLWLRDYKSMLKQIWDLGFNCIRLPYCDAMLSGTPTGIQINASGVDAYTNIKGMNTDLAGLTSLQVMDKIIAEADRVGLKIILDNHSRKPDGYMNETLWYTDTVSEDQWIANWVTLAARYKGMPNVVAADIKNEPHGNLGQGMKPPATWGYDAPGYTHTDWKKAAERCAQALVAANPKLVIVVEGVEDYRGQTYWWGGNLQGVKDAPITGVPAANLVYSAHEYGPEVYNQAWFSDPSFPANMPAIWDKNFWFIQKEGISPLFFGEFGLKEASALDPSSVGYKWLKSVMEYIGKDSSWTFWCMNPNSGDTGGILADDWVTVNQGKYQMIKPYLASQTIIVDENAKALTGFAFPALGAIGSINDGTSTITVSVPTGTDVSSMVASFDTTGASVSVGGVRQTSGANANDFSHAVTYTVTAINGTTRDYSVTVSVKPIQVAAISLGYTANPASPSSNTIGMTLRLTNTGDSPVDLSQLTLRYWYTKDGTPAQSWSCDYAGGNLVPGSYSQITSAVTGRFGSAASPSADTWLELGFGAAAGNLAPGGQVDLNVRVFNAAWSNYNQANDWSFNASNNGADWSHISAYLAGRLFKGQEPK